MAALLVHCCDLTCRPDGTEQPAWKERRVKTRSGASGDLGGSLWGPWSMGARSFDAPRRAGTVANQGSTAARRHRKQAFVIEVSVRWESDREARIEGVWTRCANQTNACVAALPQWRGQGMEGIATSWRG